MMPGLYPPIINLTYGDTWVGIPLIQIINNVTNAPPSDNVASVVMTFRNLKSAHRVAFTLSSADGTIVITNANNWTFEVPVQTLPVPKPDTEDQFWWSMQFTDVNDVVQTYLEGPFSVFINSSR